MGRQRQKVWKLPEFLPQHFFPLPQNMPSVYYDGFNNYLFVIQKWIYCFSKDKVGSFLVMDSEALRLCFWHSRLTLLLEEIAARLWIKLQLPECISRWVLGSAAKAWLQSWLTLEDLSASMNTELHFPQWISRGLWEVWQRQQWSLFRREALLPSNVWSSLVSADSWGQGRHPPPTEFRVSTAEQKTAEVLSAGGILWEGIIKTWKKLSVTAFCDFHLVFSFFQKPGNGQSFA